MGLQSCRWETDRNKNKAWGRENGAWKVETKLKSGWVSQLLGVGLRDKSNASLVRVPRSGPACFGLPQGLRTRPLPAPSEKAPMAAAARCPGAAVVFMSLTAPSSPFFSSLSCTVCPIHWFHIVFINLRSLKADLEAFLPINFFVYLACTDNVTIVCNKHTRFCYLSN